MSKINKETWEFAHQYCGKIWWILGWVLLVLSSIPLVYVIGRNVNTVGIVGGIVVAVQLLTVFCSIIPVERALKENFDKDGFRQ